MLKEKIKKEMKEALKTGDRIRLESLRFLVSKIQNSEIEKRSELSDAEVQSVIGSLVKKGEESVEMFEKGGRDDLVAQESASLAIYKSYMPEQLSDEAVESLIQEAIESTGAETMKDMGKVIGFVMEKAKNQVDGKIVSEKVRHALS